MEPFRFTFPANSNPQGITWPEPGVTFEVFDSRFNVKEVGYLIQALLPWNLFYATYEYWNRIKWPFFIQNEEIFKANKQFYLG